MSLVKSISVQWQRTGSLAHDELIFLLQTFGDLLPNPISRRLDLSVYAAKLLENADLACAVIEGKIVGLLGMYANDQGTRRAHIPFIAVLPDQRGHGIGKAMMSRAVALARHRGMRAIDLEVDASNAAAQQLYRSFDFRISGQEGSRCTMRCELPSIPRATKPTPLEEHPRLSASFDLDIDLRIKRDDLYPMAGGGIKARKIEYIMRDMIARGHDVIVTNGGPQSNHARASAVLSAQLGIRCHLIIVLEPGVSYQGSGNIMLMRLSGATIEFCAKDYLSARMDAAMNLYESKGYNPLYVWGGGHCLPGTAAFVDAAREAQEQCEDWIPDFLVAASGTGTTQAGFVVGYAGQSTRIIGISVARDASRGGRIVRDCLREYIDQTGQYLGQVDVDFRDDWTDGGYERASPKLLDVIERAAKAGVFVDSTYSGKGLRGLVEIVSRGEIHRGSKVIFWHTGGLMNLQASRFSGGSLSL